MSWDVVMVRTKTNGEELEDIASENIVPSTQAEIAEAVKKTAAALGAAYRLRQRRVHHAGRRRLVRALGKIPRRYSR